MEKIKSAYEDIEREIVKGDDVVIEVIDAKTQKAIIEQVQEEYKVAFTHSQAKRAVQLARLALYNNQRRDADAVGDPLMFTIFNTVLAALYDDRLMAVWEGRGGEGDEEVEENLNALAEFDYDIMNKSELDYAWDWDTGFFGRGLLLMMDFDRTEGVKAPIPEVIDPTCFIRDPRAVSVNGDARGLGGMRFGGYEIGATYWNLKNLKAYFNIGALKKNKEDRSLTDEASAARSLAQGTENFPQKEEELGKYNNYEFKLLNWFTTIKGKRYLITLGNERSVLVRLTELKYGGRWPIIDRALYPMAHDWDGVSIPDLTEDKQRMRAVILNLGIKGAKADEMPRYLFDRTRIKNRNDLNYKSNKYIPVDGSVEGAMAPVMKTGASQQAQIILDMLDAAAQRATATSEIQQGMPADQQRTLGELQLAAAKADTRYAMSAKIFGWSEKQFWLQWYRQYKLHFRDGIDEKIIRVQGSAAPVWRTLQKDNIISQVDPDVKIESRVISEAKRLREQQSMDALAEILLADPQVNRRYLEKKLARGRGLKKEEVDMLFPPTVDEIQAEDENILLNAGKLPKISIDDDHQTHIQIHTKAVQNAQTLAHTRAHKKLMLIKRSRPDLFPPPTQPGQQPVAGQEQMVPPNAQYAMTPQ